ncbi:DUF4349 domain-containing protein [Halegenticoccus soli]|uniref:DUF4349 domain-containing protein n=1 Tax=Halegenticoccus soli TaxID=1985678 RepID=UPI000C6CDB5A|nr:DUF4349 domain-containing protein [Halegenticoccus soli]
MRPKTSAAAALALSLLAVLAGCSGMGGVDDGGGFGSSGSTQSGDAATGADGAESGDASDGDRNLAAQVARQERIRTGEIRLRVENYESSRANLTALVRDRGGYVNNSTRRVHERENATWTTGTIVLRVPKANFTATVEGVAAEGEVESSRTATEDVTDRVVDLEARLSNLRAERDRLRDLYERANETEDVLAVGRELSDVQSEIERLEAQRRSLADRVAYSTITVRLAESAPDPETFAAGARWYDTGVVEAFLASVEGVGVVLRAAVVAAAYAAPYALAFGLPAAGAIVLWRRRR